MAVKSVLITGASRGVGRELALAFGKAGWAVGINCRSEKAKAEAVVQEIFEQGNKEADVFLADVRDSLRVRAMIDGVMTRWGRLDVLINNAGLTRDRTILKMTNAEWNDVIDVNLNGAFWCLREAARIMSKEKAGHIMNIASIMARRPGFGNANYGASKAGLVALTQTAARELGRFNISVNAILPGFHETAMSSTLSPELKAKVLSEHTLGRSTRPEDLTGLVLWLVNTTSVSGQVFSVDSRVA